MLSMFVIKNTCITVLYCDRHNNSYNYDCNYCLR